MTAEEHTMVIAQIALKLSGLKLGATFQKYEEGPVVTTYYYRLSLDVPVAKIVNKAEDIAIACNVDKVIIQRIGGSIAIEVPNANRKVIDFNDCLYKMLTSVGFSDLKLPIMLGVDTYGRPAALDLVSLPHVLIAGTTGGGKSVLLSSIIGGLACAKTPQELRFILVDTKKLDLPLFKDLPHTLDNVEDVVAFHKSMDKLMRIVRTRTEKLKGVARNVSEWNQLRPAEPMPYYVMIIDELADLIDEDAGRRYVDELYDETYTRIPARIKALVQICRAAGVHLICATQRSSVKVINGDIKANMPTRIALRLPTRVDSTTILSAGGAENLLGRGDMLVETLEAPLTRYHGAFVSNNDIVAILENAKVIREQLRAVAKV